MPVELGNDQLEALLYDWHNEHRLRDQSLDVAYWKAMCGAARRVVVLGAGTGRIAVPLAEVGVAVLAIDSNPARLARIPNHPGLTMLCADITQLPVTELDCDHALLPYSTVQMLPVQRLHATLEAIGARLNPQASLWIDISTRFQQRSPHGWRTVLRAWCPPLRKTVTERQRIVQSSGVCVIDSEFEVDGSVRLTTTERWSHLTVDDLVAAVDGTQLTCERIDEGYGEPQSRHRRIVLFRQTSPRP